MVLEKLGEMLKSVTKKIASAIFLDAKTIEAIVKDIQHALLEADVDVKLVYELCEKIRQEARSEKVRGVEKKEHITKLIYDKIIEIIGREKYELKLEKGRLQKIMFLGLYGSGKTTTIAKLAFYYSKRGFKCCMLGLDVHRPAAPEQLEQLASKINVACFTDEKEKNPLKIWEKHKNEIAKYEICFIDTAGRDALSVDLIEEIKKLEKEINPEHVLLVMPADIGQSARKQAAEFKKSCKINGVIVTRMDSTAKGGGALSACAETQARVLFLGTGEHIQDIETFSPKDFVTRMLGMGDLHALIEKVESATEKKAKVREEEKFTLLSMYEQFKSMQSLGPLSKVADMIPGFSALKGKISAENIDEQGEKLKRWKCAIDSMTSQEIEQPEMIKENRITRISKGAGVSAGEVRELLNQYKLLKGFVASGKQLDLAALERGKLPPGMSQKQLMKLARKYKGKLF